MSKNKKSSNGRSGRPKNTPLKAGFTKSSRRYKCGGKLRK